MINTNHNITSPNYGKKLTVDQNHDIGDLGAIRMSTIEDVIANRSTFTSYEIIENDGLKFKGDFYGFLNKVGVETKYFHLVLVANDMKSPSDFDFRRLTFVIPSIEYMDQLLDSDI